MAKVVWRQRAIDDLADIRAYIAQFDIPAADRHAARLQALGQSLIHFPNRGRRAPDGRREMAVVPPHLLRYEVHGDTVYIVEVRHSARSRPA